MNVLDSAGTEIGIVTSGTFSPTLKVGIALALVEPSFEIGAEVSVEIRSRTSLAEISALPLVPARVR